MTALAELGEVLTVEEAAAVLRIGRSAAYAAVQAGEIPAIRVGRLVRVPKARLAALLEPATNGSPAGGPENFAGSRTVITEGVNAATARSG